MSTAASNGKTQTAAQAPRVNPGGSVDKPAAKPGGKPAPKAMTPEQKKQVTIIGSVVAIVVAIAVGIFFYFHKSDNLGSGQRLNAPLPNLTAYMASNEFDKLDFDRKKLYIKELAGKKKEVDELHKSSRLSDVQYKEVQALMWIGKQFKHVEKYNSLGGLDRKDMLDEIIDDNKRDPKPKDVEREKRVKTLEEAFPSEEKDQVRIFRQALKDREKERKLEDIRIKREAATRKSTTTRPTTRPIERPAGVVPTAKPATPAK
jgi:hypothetical protein